MACLVVLVRNYLYPISLYAHGSTTWKGGRNQHTSLSHRVELTCVRFTFVCKRVWARSTGPSGGVNSCHYPRPQEDFGYADDKRQSEKKKEKKKKETWLENLKNRKTL